MANKIKAFPLQEDAPVNNAGGGNIASIGVDNPENGERFGEPGRKPKDKKPLILRRQIWVKKNNGS